MYHPPEKQIRIRIFVEGDLLSDVVVAGYSMWKVMSDTLKLGEYEFKLKEFTTIDGWLSYTCADGTVVQSQEA